MKKTFIVFQLNVFGLFVTTILLLLVVVVILYPDMVNAQGSVIYVDVTNNSGIENGTRNYPFNSIQEAINVISDTPLTIAVLPGTYKEKLIISDKSVILRSVSGASTTIIDADGGGSAITVSSNTSITPTVTIDGFTIKNAGGDPHLTNDGWGIFLTTSFERSLIARIQNNTIVDNNAHGGIGIATVAAPAHYEVLIDNNRIVGNLCYNNSEGCGIRVDVPGLGSTTGFIIIKNNVIVSNETYFGGGIYIDNYLNSNCIVEVSNNTIYNNTAYVGGGIHNNAYNLSLINNILFMNTAQNIGHDLYLTSAGQSASVISNIIGDGQFDGVQSNISANPLFVQPSHGNFHLQSNSPAIDAGTPVSTTVDFEGDVRPYDGDKSGEAQWDIGADEQYPPLRHSSKIVDTPIASSGQLLTYTIILNNDDVINITNVYVTDTLPLSLTYITDSLSVTGGNYGYRNGTITWTGQVSAIGSVTITFGAMVNDTISQSTFIINSVVVSGGGEIITPSIIVNIPDLSFVYLPIVLKASS